MSSVDLYNARQTRMLDAVAIDEMTILGRVLMERAGACAFSRISGSFETQQPMVVLCGPGNNGGDGYVVARLARQAGLDVRVFRSGKPATEDARSAFAAYAEQGGRVGEFAGIMPGEPALIVDALLGTGINRPPSGKIRDMIRAANASSGDVVSLDIPSGLESDTGAALTPCIQASMTVSFIGRKIGCYTGNGRDMCGVLCYESLDIPQEVFRKVKADARTISPAQMEPLSHSVHKRQCGDLVIVGGENGMLGATLLAGKAALRSGCGLVTICSTQQHKDMPAVYCPELMSACADDAAFDGLLLRCSALVLGPGLGQSAFGHAAFEHALRFSGPMVVDADGLNLLSQQPRKRHNWILTPHPGEAGRLLGCSAADVQNNRIEAAAEITRIYGGVCVLKGAGTIVKKEDGLVWVCDRGNPGMASAGMGDVLSGIAGALLAFGYEAEVSATTGTWIHSAAADFVVQHIAGRSLIASDVVDCLGKVIREITV